MTAAAWDFADAWLMVAASGSGRRGYDLSQLIVSADAHNHDIPTEEVVRRSEGRLSSSGLMAVADGRVRLTDEGGRLAKCATGGMFERAPLLLNLLRDRPLAEGQWDELSPGAWQDTYDQYRARSKHL